MNRIQWKDLLREIRKNRGRYLSLLFIVALGCAFYSGIRSSEPDMTISADRYYDETEFCDIRVVSTLGLTDEDLEAIAAVDGVVACEGSKSVELFADGEDDQPIMNVVSLGEDINKFTVREGRLPERANECFVDIRYITMYNAKLGDTITLLNTDKGVPDELTEQNYTIVGYGTWAWYLNLTRGTASIGDGSVDAFMVLLPEAFTQDYYTNIFATVEGAKEENTYSDSYDEIIDEVKERLEGIADVQVAARRESIVNEGEDAIADAKAKIADAKQELTDAEKELRDGENDYLKGLLDYEDGYVQWKNGKKDYEDGLKKWQDGKKEYESGLSSYKSGLRKYNDGLAQYEEGKAAFDEGRETLESSKQQLEAGRAAYESGLAQWNQAKETLEQKEKEISDGEAQLAAAEKELAEQKSALEAKKSELEGQKSALESQRSELEAQRTDLKSQKSDLESQRAALAGQKSDLESQRAQLAEQKKTLEQQRDAAAAAGMDTSQLNAGIAAAEAGIAQIDTALSQLEPGLTQIDAGLAQLKSGISQLDDGIAQIDSGLSQIDAGLTQIGDGMSQIEAGETEIGAQKTAIEEGKSALSQGWEEWRASGEVLEQSRKDIEAGEAELTAGEAELLANETALVEAKATLDSSKSQLDAARRKLASAKAELADGEKELADAKKELDDGEQELTDAKQELDDARVELDDGWEEFNSGKAEANEKIADAEKEIADGEKELADLDEGKWYVLTRDEIQTCVEYGMDAERIGKIASVFPLIFFLVAALVSLTTMTRMIEEERMLIGTMKALGYGKWAIISRYLVYAGSATLIGGVAGVLFGGKVLPYVIMTAYGMLYTNVPYLLMPYNVGYSLTAIGMALLCTVGAAVAACYKELLSTPAALMRPPAPRSGRKILLERIGIIWSRLNFSMKSTVRNLFRYKKRFFMTVIGIGGCMAVLLVSYGLHDSIAAIVDNQYKKVWTYSVYCSLEENLDEVEKVALREDMAGEELISESMLARNISVDVSTDAATKTAYLYVVESTDRMGDFLSLHDRETKEEYTLTDEAVILSEKLGRTLEVQPGDEVTLKISDSEYRTVKVAATAENYLYNYVYMTPALYVSVYGEAPVFNECVLRYEGALTEEQEDQLAERLLARDGVTSVHLVRTLQETVDNMMNALNLVVWVLVIAAGLLVFVVSFNLNNINISERRRELATLKVLGFYDMEVAMYVYRENIFLTLFGIAAGLFMGTWLHRYVITTLEVEMIMFGRKIGIPSYVYSSLLTMLFSIIVNVLMFYKLRQIDMVESLKSVE